jgi:CMP/dCMP kinase
MSLIKKMNAVAIDGPAGSGKSTVARLVAEKIGYVYIDTGAMYRALTLKVMKRGVEFSDERSIIELSRDSEIELIGPVDMSSPIKVMLDGEDVSETIRTMEVTSNVKHVCGIPGVRERLVDLQREMARRSQGAVMEGRDIGTVVLPDAGHKFYLDASFEERVQRRLAEMKCKGHPVTRQEVAEDLKARDHTDKTRKVGPLKKADDAVVVDTTGLNISQVVAIIAGHVAGE